MNGSTRRGVLAAATGGIAALSGCSGMAKGVRQLPRLVRGGRRLNEERNNENNGTRRGRESDEGSERTDIGDLENDVSGIELNDSSSETDRSTTEVNDTAIGDDLSELDVALYSDDDTIEIDAYSWYYWEWDLDPPADTDGALVLEYEIVVRGGPPVDVFVMDPDEYAFYRDGDNSVYLVEPSALRTSYETREVELEPQSYVFVIDNTNAGEAAPSGPEDAATVSVEYRLEGPLAWRSA